MRARYTTLIIVATLLLTGVFGVVSVSGVNVAKADNLSGQEAITFFQSVVTVNLDNSINVKELIQYTTGAQNRHGIYRDIYPYSSEGRLMNIKNVSVVDEKGNPYQWEELSNGPYERIKIGDPNVTFTGDKVYVINYTATNAVAHPKDVDEIYWNATGNNWNIPIYKSQAIVYLPTGVTATQFSCYYGIIGSPSKCERDPSYPTYSFTSPRSLNAGEGLTVAVGFPKGIIPAYSTIDNVSNIGHQYLDLLLALVLPLLVFIGMFIRWWQVGRDPKDTNTIIAEYDVPDGLTPFEVSCIVNQKIRNTDISAEIVYLATKGYLKIRYIDNKMLGFIKVSDYEIELLKDYSDLVNQFDTNLLDGIFGDANSVGSKVKLSDLKNKFYTNIPGISDAVVDSMLKKGYYSHLKKSLSSSTGWSSNNVFQYFKILIIVVVYAMFFGLAGSTILASDPGLFAVSIIATIAIVTFFMHIMPAKTVKGVATRDYILGLKLYLQIAEKDRLAFHNAPAKRPEIFEKLLPYAMVLGVDEAWAKEFEGIYTTPPTWYEGYPIGTGRFNTVAFNHSLSNFGSATSSTMGSAPGGGSGGGGFSGGGGGGGGGGGW